MNLFKKEKDLIFKIANLILVLWLVISLSLFYVSVVNLIITEPIMTFEEYADINCYYEEDKNNDCHRAYDQYKLYQHPDNYFYQQMLFTTAGITIIISTTLYLLNKRKEV
ncbi:MAG: hypothetical protein ACOXZW_01335 [Bacilli bacterium]|jgi:hypothetical protein|nr:hypothetical protein [Bacilli bacterium]